MLVKKVSMLFIMSSIVSSLTLAKEGDFHPSHPEKKIVFGPAFTERKEINNGKQKVSNFVGIGYDFEQNFKPNDLGVFRLKMDHKASSAGAISEGKIDIGSLFNDKEEDISFFEFGAKLKTEGDSARIAAFSIGTGLPNLNNKLNVTFKDKEGKLKGHLCGKIAPINLLLGYIKNSDKSKTSYIANESEANICGGVKMGEIGYLTGDAGIMALNGNEQLSAQVGLELSQIANTSAALSYRYRKDYFNDETTKSSTEYGTHRLNVGAAF